MQIDDFKLKQTEKQLQKCQEEENNQVSTRIQVAEQNYLKNAKVAGAVVRRASLQRLRRKRDEEDVSSSSEQDEGTPLIRRRKRGTPDYSSQSSCGYYRLNNQRVGTIIQQSSC